MATNAHPDCPPPYSPVATAADDPSRTLPDYTGPVHSTESSTGEEPRAWLTCHPDYDAESRTHRNAGEDARGCLKEQRKAFSELWHAIRDENLELIHEMIETDHIISPCALDATGQSPLTIALLWGKFDAVRKLVSLGADVNQFAVGDYQGSQRTPLQVAASRGYITMVRFLVGECGANDALIAEDGQLALRLAADGGFGDIVEYLPLRRGGGWRRWKVQHSKAIKRATKAAKKFKKFLFIVFCQTPYCLLLWGPFKTGMWVWRHREGIARCLGAAVIGVPTLAYRAVKDIPRMVASAAKWLWKAAKKAPEMIKMVAGILGRWLGRAIRGLGGAVVYIFKQLFSVLHTVVEALLRLKDLTFQDVWNGFCTLARAVFVNLPRAVAETLCGLAEASYELFKGVLGLFGKMTWWILQALFFIITYIPLQLVSIIRAFGRSIAKGFQEVAVWYDPKRS